MQPKHNTEWCGINHFFNVVNSFYKKELISKDAIHISVIYPSICHSYINWIYSPMTESLILLHYIPRLSLPSPTPTSYYGGKSSTQRSWQSWKLRRNAEQSVSEEREATLYDQIISSSFTDIQYYLYAYLSSCFVEQTFQFKSLIIPENLELWQKK